MEAHLESAERERNLLPAAPGTGTLLSGREHLKWVYRLLYYEWLKPRPESGLDCLICSTFEKGGAPRDGEARTEPSFRCCGCLPQPPMRGGQKSIRPQAAVSKVNSPSGSSFPLLRVLVAATPDSWKGLGLVKSRFALRQ